MEIIFSCKHVDTSTYSSISFMREQEAELIVTNGVNTLCVLKYNQMKSKIQLASYES